MKRFMPLFSIIASLLTTHAAKAEDADMKVTSLHRAITQQDEWLNTSRNLTPEDLKGRIILLDFWTFCCINCMHVIPDLHYLEEEFGDKLTVIGVHSAKFTNERDKENIRNAMLRYDVEHPVTNDHDFAVWQSFHVRAWPTFVLINPLGAIQEVYSGEGNRDLVEADIRKLLTKFEGKINTAPLPIALEKDKEPERFLDFPGKLAVIEQDGSAKLAISDSGNHRIVLTDLQGKVLTTIGSGAKGFQDGDAKAAQFNNPQGLLTGTHDGKKVLYVADTSNHAIRRIDIASGQVTTIAGTGKQGYLREFKRLPALKVELASPWDLEYLDKDTIAIAMAGTHQLWMYDLIDQSLSVLAGNGRESIDDGSYPRNSLSQPSGLSAEDGKLYFVDSETSSLRVLEDGEIHTLIGTGLFDYGFKEGSRKEALLQHPLGVYADGNDIYIADSYNHAIRRYNAATKVLHNYAGNAVRGSQDGAIDFASFNEPNDVVRYQNTLYIADTNNHRIRVINLLDKTVSTLPVGSALKSNVKATPVEPPNLLVLPSRPVSMSAAILTLELPEGWKINDEAPSSLELQQNGETVKIYTLDEIKMLRLPLPAMSDEKSYQLEGTFYYCEEKDGSQCLIRSIRMGLVPHAEATTEISIPVR